MAKLYTVKEVAEMLKLSAWVVREKLRSGKLEGYDMGGSWRVSQEHIDKFLGIVANRPSDED